MRAGLQMLRRLPFRLRLLVIIAVCIVGLVLIAVAGLVQGNVDPTAASALAISALAFLIALPAYEFGQHDRRAQQRHNRRVEDLLEQILAVGVALLPPDDEPDH